MKSEFNRETTTLESGRQRTLCRSTRGDISAEIVEDSLAPNGKRLTTFVLKYPRFVHSEFMTHRDFSRNAASSRAIPVKKIRARVWGRPAMPIFWGKNRPGMVAEQQLQGWRLLAARGLWKLAGKMMVVVAYLLDSLGLHKQIANRILEAWFTITVVCTATEYGNFFNLRCAPDAQPEIRELTEAMLMAYRHNKPFQVTEFGWHLPFVTETERATCKIDELIRFSVARCARTSYENHDGTVADPGKDFSLYQRLLSQLHTSPFEHQAVPAKAADERFGNLKGWEQFRQSIPNQYRPTFEAANG